MLDDALEGHAELSDVHPGARLRILATEDLIDGTFARYDALEAVEYIPPPSEREAPLRVYFFGKEPTTTWLARSAKQRDNSKAPSFYYDAKGRQPMHGGWKSPVPFARIASRFNPHRMHPVLHVVMPHNGVDFAASTGTPVYVTAEGTVKSVGGGGPCGNMVQILHSNNYTSAYCHLSRFAAGLHAGQHVEPRQLVGYVGQTGRATGPHLHFAVKRGDAFIDPLVLKLDGVRVVPLGDRAEFERVRAELDLALDAIALPAAAAAAATRAPRRDVDAGSDEIFEEAPRHARRLVIYSTGNCPDARGVRPPRPHRPRRRRQAARLGAPSRALAIFSAAVPCSAASGPGRWSTSTRSPARPGRFFPIPVATSVGLTAMETHLIYWIGRIYGDHPSSMDVAMSVAAGLELASVGLKTFAIEAANFVPVIGWGVKGAIAGSAIEGHRGARHPSLRGEVSGQGGVVPWYRGRREDGVEVHAGGQSRAVRHRLRRACS